MVSWCLTTNIKHQGKIPKPTSSQRDVCYKTIPFICCSSSWSKNTTMFTRSPNWPPISFARSDEWRCFGHARKLNRGHKSRSRLDITTKSWPCSCKQSPINIILVQVVSLSFEMVGWGGGGVTNCHSFLLSNPTLSLSSPLKTMLDAAANDLILNWNCFLVLQHKSCPNNQNNLFEVVKGCCWIYWWHEQ